MTVNWREVCKFASGAAFAGSIANFYLWSAGVSVPFLGHAIPPGVMGTRSVVQFVLFVVFFYLGWLRR